MKVIDLVSSIAIGEKVPYKIRINDREYLYDKYSNWYFSGKTSEDMFINKDRLNDEVEILQEEKKIPEKIDYIVEKEKGLLGEYNNYYLSFEKANVELCDVDKFIIDKINEIIDYLKK